ncbi:MAG: hypothetical protein DSY80_01950 [Desulfocapsa sp.]|nr:MAG: hypothetical protein DSY80_01950 [Desulfocapsa sp.]
MSTALFDEIGGLRFWNEREILSRTHVQEQLVLAVKIGLRRVNPAWRFFQCETPILTPETHIHAEYVGGSDVYITNGKAAGHGLYMRPETTAGSYAYMKQLLNKSKVRLPLCVWQAGKSFRQEVNDGASAAKLRFNEFWQLEFQCCYAEGTKADYQAHILPDLLATMLTLGSGKVRTVDSDRLPSYSTKTVDIEMYDFSYDRWVEVASISERTDNENGHVLEIAIGLDRLVSL